VEEGMEKGRGENGEKVGREMEAAVSEPQPTPILQNQNQNGDKRDHKDKQISMCY